MAPRSHSRIARRATEKSHLLNARSKNPCLSEVPSEPEAQTLFCCKAPLKIGEMSKRGKKRDDEEALSEGDEPPKKSAKPSASAVDNDSDESDNIVVCELSKNRKVSVRNWNGKVVVDIREFYYKDGKEMPGKKGISLTMDQWKILRDHVDEIDQEVAEN
ncbi:unnamed protein product [Fraxinus pennsylvanica]|uniref:Transcriptional coactivator p15 (PC4) C-terminal domain-containing protein n=1 Tax=Fraxinus pennsylvanica TaxID=56036 RepID=A0AAD2DG33_9LAMI|nr:unnamed protein product [Fraxinus pennsylvanica]